MPGDPEPLLRRHDPAEGKVLTAGDRARTLQSARARHRLTPPRLAAAFGLFLVLAAVLMVSHRREAAPPAVRQIQYATPGGTRIVWTLDPRFHM
jgi:uncharacterized membrane protein YfcA